MSEIRYMISETAKQVDVEAHVLRYWEEELSLPIDRNEMGHRYYTEDDITLFKNIKELKERGFQLKAIKMLLPELRRNGRLDMDKLLKQREALNQAVEEAETPDSSQMQTVSKAATGQKTQAIPKAQATQNVQMTESNTQETIEGKRKTRADSEKNTGEQIKSEELPAEEAQVTAPTAPAEGDRMQQFQMILGNIVLKALQENNRELSRSVSDQVSDQVSDNVLKEMDYLMRVREEREDERFKKLDETIRLTQRSRKEAAAARVEARRLKKLEKKEKKQSRGGLFAKR